jgi:hypothetical protein
MLLKTCVRAEISTCGNYLRISPVMTSYPGAFVERKRLIAALTSVTVKFLIGDVASTSVSSVCSVSRSTPPSWSGMCGWKTCSKWSASVFALCTSLLAHSPPGVLSGGISVCARWSRFVSPDMVSISPVVKNILTFWHRNFFNFF